MSLINICKLWLYKILYKEVVYDRDLKYIKWFNSKKDRQKYFFFIKGVGVIYVNLYNKRGTHRVFIDRWVKNHQYLITNKK